jgi:hypothetical protein
VSLKQIYQIIRNFVTTHKLSRRCQGYGLSTVLTALRQFRLCQKHRYEPVEAFRLGLFSPNFDPSCLNEFLSRKNTTHLQESLNPPALAPLFKNKAIFYQRYAAQGLPLPQLYGLFSYPDKTIHSFRDGTFMPIVDKEAFVNSLPKRFAIKPVDESLGRGFRIITRTPDVFTDPDGGLYDTKQFFSLLAHTSSIGTLMQEIVENHPDIVSLSGVNGLQTVRIITLVDVDNRVEILSTFFKTIISPKIVIDTFIDNMTGNLEVTIDPDKGTLIEACYLDGAGSGIVVVDNHPVTGKPFKGFALPYWPQICQLARSTAIAALPVRTIGWDIAVTAHGPCLIEGNIWWNPPNQHRAMGRIAEQMNTVITKLADNPIKKAL